MHFPSFASFGAFARVISHFLIFRTDFLTAEIIAEQLFFIINEQILSNKNEQIKSTNELYGTD